MKYLNLILTVIAILLFLHLIKPIIGTDKVKANSWTNVNIAAVGGKAILYGERVPVE